MYINNKLTESIYFQNTESFLTLHFSPFFLYINKHIKGITHLVLTALIGVLIILTLRHLKNTYPD